ncbi:MAG TPA: GNAT family N-acetyltransferase [Kiloniellales bacterium]|jgi:GNAT superfamily N-acetyltransferase
MAWSSHATIAVRPAQAHEAEALTVIALTSKAHWGYDDAFMDMCRVELSVSPAEIEQRLVVVAQVGDEIAGFYSLEPDGEDGAEVHSLFIRPDFIGQGIGRILFEHMCRQASSAGVQALFLDSDPFARGFYERMGCVVIGEAPSGSIPGRMLPRMRRPLELKTGTAP